MMIDFLAIFPSIAYDILITYYLLYYIQEVYARRRFTLFTRLPMRRMFWFRLCHIRRPRPIFILLSHSKHVRGHSGQDMRADYCLILAFYYYLLCKRLIVASQNISITVMSYISTYRQRPGWHLHAISYWLQRHAQPRFSQPDITATPHCCNVGPRHAFPDTIYIYITPQICDTGLVSKS